MKIIGTRFDASPAQVATAWAIAKGTLPIIGVTKVTQVEEAVQAAQIKLTVDEISRLEKLGDETGVHTLRGAKTAQGKSQMNEGDVCFEFGRYIDRISGRGRNCCTESGVEEIL